VWRAQGVGDTSEAHERMDKTSRTDGGENVLTTDACTKCPTTGRPGLGAFYGREEFFVDVPLAKREEHIGLHEFRIGPIVIGGRWAHHFENKRLLWRIDNMIAVAAVRKGYSGLAAVDELLPEFGELLWEKRIDLWAMHIAGVKNERADSVSRYKP
jgi:hypothetical protein